MDNRMSAVGASASAPKSDAMKSGSEIFEGRASIKAAEDGGFVISADYRKEPPKGSKDPFPMYCPPKEYVAPDLEGAVAKLRELFGGRAPARVDDMGPPPQAGPAGPPPVMHESGFDTY